MSIRQFIDDFVLRNSCMKIECANKPAPSDISLNSQALLLLELKDHLDLILVKRRQL